MSNPLVSIIVLNFNSEQKTKLCLESLNKSVYSPLNIIVVDNSTRKSSTAYVKEIANKHSLDFIHLTENNGYAAANKVGVDLAMEKNAEYIFVLNNDTIVDPDCISNMVSTMEIDKSIAISGPILYDLEYQNNSFMKTDKVQSCGLRINSFTGRTVSNSNNINDKISEHPIISGAALMIRKSIIEEFGFMKDYFFLYYEETDYCLSLKKENPNIKICTINNAYIWHESSNNIDEKLYSLYYSHRNKIIFMRKHFSKTFPVFLCFLFIFSIPKKIIKNNNSAFIKALYKATRDGLLNRIHGRI